MRNKTRDELDELEWKKIENQVNISSSSSIAMKKGP